MNMLLGLRLLEEVESARALSFPRLRDSGRRAIEYECDFLDEWVASVGGAGEGDSGPEEESS
ncbi:hypothetical protein PG991_013251 [Apiospora marii]|uniref:Uncharacterized protein n=1 Tax=Apiospora marii TaxID=335849 RepID=A0ABR1R5G7_9PEZI